MYITADDSVHFTRNEIPLLVEVFSTYIRESKDLGIPLEEIQPVQKMFDKLVELT